MHTACGAARHCAGCNDQQHMTRCISKLYGTAEHKVCIVKPTCQKMKEPCMMLATVASDQVSLLSWCEANWSLLCTFTICINILHGCDSGCRSPCLTCYLSQFAAAQSAAPLMPPLMQVRQYVAHIKQQALSNGYVTTIAGRRRPIKPLLDQAQGSEAAQAKRAAAEADRKAVNSTIQGSAADLINATKGQCIHVDGCLLLILHSSPARRIATAATNATFVAM